MNTLDIAVTVDRMHAKHPCGWNKEDDGDNYTIERITRLWDGMPARTLLEILDLDISAADRIWAVTRFLPDRENRLFAVWCARDKLSRIDNPDPRSIAACAVAERYAHGKATDEELSVANAAAADAAWTTTREAEWTAAWVAAAVARAADAAWDIADTAWYAADAEWNAADAEWDAAREKTIEYLRSILRNGGCDE